MRSTSNLRARECAYKQQRHNPADCAAGWAPVSTSSSGRGARAYMSLGQVSSSGKLRAHCANDREGSSCSKVASCGRRVQPATHTHRCIMTPFTLIVCGESAQKSGCVAAIYFAHHNISATGTVWRWSQVGTNEPLGPPTSAARTMKTKTKPTLRSALRRPRHQASLCWWGRQRWARKLTRRGRERACSVRKSVHLEP